MILTVLSLVGNNGSIHHRVCANLYEGLAAVYDKLIAALVKKADGSVCGGLFPFDGLRTSARNIVSVSFADTVHVVVTVLVVRVVGRTVNYYNIFKSKLSARGVVNVSGTELIPLLREVFFIIYIIGRVRV